MRTVEIKQRAMDDLREISDYIARDDPSQAESYIAELLKRIAWVGDNPLLYRVRLRWKHDLRIAHHGRYQIVYRADDVSVVILRIAHSSRDLNALLEEIE
ncbi:type II toxin-antitoxin system RelE/ParE family toxin [Pelagerythrobacter marensis]|uniref:Type II toxin-antitoxin system RelE/ParE family toxin n=1 Tax=Pelagerythrobacter marensis TaxID=543877 RepID=A0ABZ2D5Z3_9SPHN